MRVSAVQDVNLAGGGNTLPCQRKSLIEQLAGDADALHVPDGQTNRSVRGANW